MSIHLRSDGPRRARVARSKPATPPPGQLTLTGIWGDRWAAKTAPRLPVELLEEIFKLAQNVAITRVCKLWRRIALPILFDTVVIHDADARRRLIRVGSASTPTPWGPQRAAAQVACVKDVYIRGIPDDDGEGSALRRLFPTSTLHAHVSGRAPAHGDLNFYDTIVYDCLRPGKTFAPFGLGTVRLARASVHCNSARWHDLLPVVRACLDSPMLGVLQLRVYTRAPSLAATRLWTELRALDDVRLRVVRVAEDPEVERPETKEGEDVWVKLCSGLFSWEDGENVWP